MSLFQTKQDIEIYEALKDLSFYVWESYDPNKKPELNCRTFSGTNLLGKNNLNCLAVQLNNAIKPVIDAWRQNILEEIKQGINSENLS
jgi:hypothetical protein